MAARDRDPDAESLVQLCRQTGLQHLQPNEVSNFRMQATKCLRGPLERTLLSRLAKHFSSTAAAKRIRSDVSEVKARGISTQRQHTTELLLGHIMEEKRRLTQQLQEQAAALAREEVRRFKCIFMLPGWPCMATF
jgi:hypothetical protein